MSHSSQEKYMRARQTSNLRLSPNAQGAPDVLIAAASVTRESPRRSVALAVFGVLASERMAGAHEVAQVMAGWLRKKSHKETGAALPEVTTVDISMMLLKKMHKPTCLSCNGHGHPIIPSTPMLDESRECQACHGTGQIPMARLFRYEHVPYAEWLEGELNGLCKIVFSDMALVLKADMDLT
jgi:hypothetical protein